MLLFDDLLLFDDFFPPEGDLLLFDDLLLLPDLLLFEVDAEALSFDTEVEDDDFFFDLLPESDEEEAEEESPLSLRFESKLIRNAFFLIFSPPFKTVFGADFIL